MTLRIILLSALFAAFAWPATPGFETHYLDVGQGRSLASVAVSLIDGSMFFITTSGAVTNGMVGPGRIIKTDAKGNTIAMVEGRGAAAVDPQGNLVLVGYANLPAPPTVTQIGPVIPNGCSSVMKIDTNLTQITAAASICGGATAGSPVFNAVTGLNAVATDQQGNVYLAGSTSSVDFPTTLGAYQPNVPKGFNGDYNPIYAFLIKLSPDLSTVVYCTYYGTPDGNSRPPTFVSATTSATVIVVDSRGAATLGGSSDALSYQQTYGMIARFSPDGSALEAATPLNLTSTSIAPLSVVNGLALDGEGNTWAAGGSGYLAELNSTLKAATGSYISNTGINTRLPGPLTHPLTGVVIDPQGNVWVTGVSDPAYLPGGDPAHPQGTTIPYIAELAGDGSLLSVLPMPTGGVGMAEGPGGSIVVLGSPDSFLLSSPTAKAGPFIVNSSANNVSSGTVAPGELVSLYGSGIGPAAALGGVVKDGVFSNNVGGYQVLFNDIPAPLLYVGPNQINTVVPEELNFLTATGVTSPTASLKVVGPNGTLNLPSVFVVPSRPEIFGKTFNGLYGPSFQAIALNEDGTVNSATDPATPGSIVTIWVTGLGYENAVDGSIIQQPVGSVPVSITSPGTPLDVLYASDAPEQVLGLTQINFRAPAPEAGAVALNGYFVIQTPSGSAAGYIFVTPQ